MNQKLDDVYSTASDFKGGMSQMQLRATNWRGIIYSLLITSRKYWDDNYYWNCDVVDALKLFDKRYTKIFENLVLQMLNFRLFIGRDEFQKNYISLIDYHHKVFS